MKELFSSEADIVFGGVAFDSDGWYWDEGSGGSGGGAAGSMTGWQFAGAVLAIGAATIAIATAPAWGAVGGVLAIGTAGANAMSSYANRSQP